MSVSVICKRFVLITALVFAVNLQAVVRAETGSRDVVGTDVRIDVQRKTLSLVDKNHFLTVAVLPGIPDRNPRIKVTGWDPNGRVHLENPNASSVIFIDLYTVMPGFRTAAFSVDMGWVKSLRVGHHKDRVRIVLDGVNSDIPTTEIERRDDGLVVMLNTPDDPVEKPARPVSPVAAVIDLKRFAPVDAPIDQAGSGQEESIGTTVWSGKRGRASQIVQQALFEGTHLEDTPESRLFQEAAAHFRSREWTMAQTKIQQIIAQYPDSPYAERGSFLMPEILGEQYAANLSEHYLPVSESFRNALALYPDSQYSTGALLHLAQLHKNIGNYVEALAYYQLVRDRVSEDTMIARWAMLDTATIFRVRNREKQALSLLQKLLEISDNPLIRDVAMLEAAGIYHDDNFFKRSLHMLEQLISSDQENYIRFPDVSFYMGNNYFQLGQYALAKKHWLHYYNVSLEKQDPDMILARIGDACLQDGQTKDAISFFLFVVKHHPGTKGAKIAWLRLAEQKEKDPDTQIGIYYTARQIYENIRDAYLEQSINDPLALLSILKLAVLYQKAKNYSQSLETLHLLFENNPGGSLLENGRFALKNVLEIMIKEAFEAGDFKRVVFLYSSEAKRVHPLLDSDDILLMVARAYLHLNNKPGALAFYNKAGAFIPVEEAPDDLLFFTGKDLFQASDMPAARQRLARLLKQYPRSPYAGEALDIMAQILIDQQNFQEAVAMMERALNHPLPPCDRAGLLVRMGGAALGSKDLEKTLSVLEKAGDALDDCTALSGYLGDRVGDLYYQMGRFDQAVSAYTRVLELADPRVETAALQYKIGLGLWRSGEKKEGQDMLETLAGENDPFWSHLAKEYLASEAFDKKIR